MSAEQIEHQIAKLASELEQLRLPHKLNQYRAYEKKLLSIKKLAQSDNNQSFDTQLDQLQSRLDNSVLCGVSQCFLCGSSQNVPVSGHTPVYSRSVSARFSTERSKPDTHNGIRSALPKYGKQISYHVTSTKEELKTESPVSPDIALSISPSAQEETHGYDPKIEVDNNVKEVPESSTNAMQEYGKSADSMEDLGMLSAEHGPCPLANDKGKRGEMCIKK